MPVEKINPPLGSHDPNKEIKTRIRLIRQLEKLIKEEVEDAILNEEFKPDAVKSNMDRINFMQIEIQKNIKILNNLTGGEFFHYNDNDKYVDEEPCHLATENQSSVSVNIATFDESDIDDVMDAIAHAHGEREHPTDPLDNPENITGITTVDGFYFDIKDGKVDVSKLLTYLKKNRENQKLMGDLYNTGGKGSFAKRGNYIGRTPADDEQERHNKVIEENWAKFLKKNEKDSKQNKEPQKVQFVHKLEDKCEIEELKKVKKELAIAKQALADEQINKKRSALAKHKVVNPVTNFINYVGVRQYKHYCKNTIKNGSINGQEHLESFLTNKKLMENIEDEVKDKINDDIKMKMPKKPKDKKKKLWEASSWISIQTIVFDELGIERTGQSSKRK